MKKTLLAFGIILAACSSQGPTDRMLFITNANGNSDIYLMNMVNNQVIQLTESPEDEWGATWVGTHEISFLRKRGNSAERHILYLYTGMEERVEMPKPCDSLNDNIVYNGYGEGLYSCGQNVYIQISSDSTYIVMRSDSAQFRDLQWDYNDRDILFTSDRSGRKEVYMLQRDQGEVAKLSNENADSKLGVPSPDGKLIAYRSASEDGKGNILIVNRSSGEIIKTLPSAGSSFGTWSWDSRILYYEDQAEGSIYSYSLDTEENRLISDQSHSPQVYRPQYNPTMN